MNEYLQQLYQAWRNNPTGLFGNIPIDQIGETGYTTVCPPIPWMGDIGTAQFGLISLEPLLKLTNFWQQVQASFNYIGWRNFYFENYYHNFFNLFGITQYWGYIAALAQGLSNNGAHENNLAQNVNALSQNLIEFPFCQYHALNHPNGITAELSNDFNQRLTFFAATERRKIICLGRPISDHVRQQFPSAVVVDSNMIRTAHPTNAPAICRGDQYPIEVRDITINNSSFRFFLRNAPFSNKCQPTHQGCYEIGQLISQYP